MPAQPGFPPCSGRFLFVSATLCVLYPTACRADMVWPSLMVIEPYYGSGAVFLGYLIEIFVLRYAAALSLKRAFVWATIVNALSALAGVFLLPVSGLLHGVVMLPVYYLFHIGTFNPISIVLELLGNALATTLFELLVLRFPLKTRLDKRGVFLFYLANVASVGAAYAVLWAEGF